MLEHSYYSVISPEGCSAILWKTSDRAADAAKALKMTARDLLGFGIVDSIVEEPLGGAHRDPQATAVTLKKIILASIEELSRIKTTELLKRRYEKYRQIGAYHSTSSQVTSFQGTTSTPSSTKPLSPLTATSFKN
jgi:acetyl-CoA carboxylase carboxyl transferase subunit alpha